MLLQAATRRSPPGSGDLDVTFVLVLLTSSQELKWPVTLEIKPVLWGFPSSSGAFSAHTEFQSVKEVLGQNPEGHADL